MGNLRKFRGLRAEDKRLLLAAAVLLPLVGLGLRVLGLKRVQALLRYLVPAAPDRDSSEGAPLARRAAHRVSVAAGYVGGACLAQSLVLAWLLERRGIRPDVRIGVRKNEQGFGAHAWVELDGAILGGGQDIADRFASFGRSFGLP